MEQIMVDAAAQTGNIEALYDLLKQNPFLLDEIDKIPFVNTPLHTATSFGSTHFAIEILNLKPSFARKLNPNGFSPLDLELRAGQMQTVQRLVDFDPELIRVKGKEGFTPLHYVAQVNDANQLALFLLRCQKSIEDLNIQRESAAHVAVKNGNVEAFKVIMGWLRRTQKEEILNLEDENGDTILHIAAATNSYEVVQLLAKKVRINFQNKDGLTPLDVAMGLVNDAAPAEGKIKRLLRSAGAKRYSKLPKTDSLSELLTYKESSFRRMLFRQKIPAESLDNLSGETRSALLVVAVLVVTATYQAILSPPGGISSAGGSSSTGPLIRLSLQLHDTTNALAPNAPTPYAPAPNAPTPYAPAPTPYPNDACENPSGKAQMGPSNYSIFLILNTIPFYASLGMIAALLPKTNYNSLLVVPLLSLSLCYNFSAAIISPMLDLLSCLPYGLIAFGVFLLSVRSTSVKYQIQTRVQPTMLLANDEREN